MGRMMIKTEPKHCNLLHTANGMSTADVQRALGMQA